MFISEHKYYKNIAKQMDNNFKTNFSNEKIIDRAILRILIANDSSVLKIMAEIVKPYITQEILDLKKTSHTKIIVEAPLLFEQNIAYIFDKTILVICPDEERIKRIATRNPEMSHEYIQKIINSQISQREKEKMADLIICNDKKEDLKIRIEQTIEQIETQLSKSYNSNF